MAAGANAAERLRERGAGEAKLVRGELLSVPEACQFLGVHRNTLYKLIREGEVPAFRLTRGGRWKFRRADLEQWLEDRQAQGTL